MDPNATLAEIQGLTYISSTLEEDHDIDKVVEALINWLVRGGFEPDWQAYPLARKYVQSRLALYKRMSRLSIIDEGNKISCTIERI